ncbi:MAG: hypothetical protein R8M38_08065 [Mariprofundaceae bacterium]
MNMDGFDSIIIDLDGALMVLKGGKLTAIASISEVSGNKMVLSDYQGAMPYAMMVDAPEKYVAPIVERRLQEEGMLEGPGKILVHCKRSYGSVLTHVFCTAVPAETYAIYEQAEDRDDDHHVTFSFNAALYAQLRAKRSPKPVAFLFVHGRHVDLVVGEMNKVHAARRISVFGGEEEHTLICDSVVNSLREIESASNITIKKVYVNAFRHDKMPAISSEISREMSVDCQDIASKTYAMDGGERYSSSVMAMAESLRIGDAHAEPLKNLHYASWRLLPLAAVMLLGFTVALFAASLAWDFQTSAIQAEAKNIRQTFDKEQSSLASIPNLREKTTFKKALNLASDIERAQTLPSMQEVLSDLSYASRPTVMVDHISVEYEQDKVQVLISGQIKASFGAGIEAYSYLIASMQKRGYTLIEKNMGMDMKVNTFTLKMERDFAKKQT